MIPTQKKYTVFAWKTRNAYIKTGRYFQPPLQVNDFEKAKQMADDLVKTHKVYIATVRTKNSHLPVYENCIQIKPHNS